MLIDHVWERREISIIYVAGNPEGKTLGGSRYRYPRE
jgi:hypothetical protein